MHRSGRARGEPAPSSEPAGSEQSQRQRARSRSAGPPAAPGLTISGRLLLVRRGEGSRGAGGRNSSPQVEPLHSAGRRRPVLPALLGTHSCALQHPLQLRESGAPRQAAHQRPQARAGQSQRPARGCPQMSQAGRDHASRPSPTQVLALAGGTLVLKTDPAVACLALPL